MSLVDEQCMLCKQTIGSTGNDPRLPTASKRHDEDQNLEVAPFDRYLSELLDMDALPNGVTSNPNIPSSSKGKSTRTPLSTGSRRREATGSGKGKLFLLKEGKLSNIPISETSDQTQVFQVRCLLNFEYFAEFLAH